MTRFIRLVPLTAVCFLLAGPAPAGEKQEKQVQVKKETTAPQKEQEKRTPTQFLTQAIDYNMSELDLAQKAASGAATEKVKKFAEQLVDDHRKLNKRLM